MHSFSLHWHTCKVTKHDDERNYYDFKSVNGVDLTVTHLVGDEFCSSFVDYPLTNSAKEKLTEFIENACKQFADWWTKQ